MKIKIGDNNKIKNSSIGHQININTDENSKNNHRANSFAQRHPILLSIIISMATGIFLLFSFWKYVIDFIEGLF
ncbi:hypothetical protein MH215_10395 [Paenibacillus sp. ACRSA]|uniref:hypothetical protein n=1 Tax=Paenibacillus sp. ACRSA TaxID=2918211 RepID=UPI001EF74499|nr:hypothetical protein [Paenibacillus sp. ACRSA]MCG7377405.1 hypothetical protein [Paenibacillus sp. ACRSA]